MKKRSIALPLTLLIVGLVIVLSAWASTGNNDLSESLCELGNSTGAITGEAQEDCAQNDEVVWFVIGGVLVVLGMLGFVIRSSTGAAIDETPAPPLSGSVTDELQKAAGLHASGAITDEEFAAVKKRLLR